MPTSSWRQLTWAVTVLSWALATTSDALGAALDLPIHIRDSSATAQVRIGTPPVLHMLLLSTGASTTWLVDTACFDAGYCPNTSNWPRAPYDSNASSTYKVVGVRQGIWDPPTTKVVNGVPVSDTFSFPALRDSAQVWFPPYTQSFVEADSSEWYNIPADGILSLDFGADVSNTTSVFETLMGQDVLNQPRFGVYMGRETRDTTGRTPSGRLTFGGSHEEVYVEGGVNGVVWTAVELDPEVVRCCGKFYTDWATVSAGVETTQTLPGGSVVTTPVRELGIPETSGRAIFDSHIPNIQMPGGYLGALYRAIGMEYRPGIPQPWMTPCSEFNSSWSVTFMLGRGAPLANITLRGDQLRLPGYAGRDEICAPPFDRAYPYTGLWKFGTLATRHLYTIYDYGSFNLTRKDFKARIGFGPLKEEWMPII